MPGVYDGTGKAAARRGESMKPPLLDGDSGRSRLNSLREEAKRATPERRYEINRETSRILAQMQRDEGVFAPPTKEQDYTITDPVTAPKWYHPDYPPELVIAFTEEQLIGEGLKLSGKWGIAFPEEWDLSTPFEKKRTIFLDVVCSDEMRLKYEAWRKSQEPPEGPGRIYHRLINTLEPGHFITDYIEYWSGRTDAYTELHHLSAVTLLSIAIDRKIIIPLSFGDVFTNTWCMALGQSSVARKTTALNKASIMAGAVYYENVLPGSFSTEGFFEKLSERPRAWMVKDECAGILQGINKKAYLADLRDLLAELFECQSVRRSLRTGRKKEKTEFVIVDPYVTLAWATTPENFEESITPLDVKSGMLARFLYYHPRYPKETKGVGLATRTMHDGLSALGNKYSAVRMALEPFYEIKLSPAGESLDQFNTWYIEKQRELTQAYTIEGTVFSRVSTYIFKLAAIYYIGSRKFIEDADAFLKTCRPFNAPKRPDGQAELIKADFTIPHSYFMEALNNTRDYFLPVAVDLVAGVEVKASNNIQKKILQDIRDQGGVVDRSWLIRKERIKAKELDEHLATLEEAESIKVDLRETDEGKKKKTYYVLNGEVPV